MEEILQYISREIIKTEIKLRYIIQEENQKYQEKTKLNRSTKPMNTGIILH